MLAVCPSTVGEWVLSDHFEALVGASETERTIAGFLAALGNAVKKGPKFGS
jgi:hypothetical protein